MRKRNRKDTIYYPRKDGKPREFEHLFILNICNRWGFTELVDMGRIRRSKCEAIAKKAIAVANSYGMDFSYKII